MRVKIGDRWHDVSSASPICIELSECDRRNIAAMSPTATKYAVFTDDDPRSPEQKLEWMS
jgi:hypothetical protein